VWIAAALLLLGVSAGGPAARGEGPSDPFRLQTLRVPGRPIEVFAVPEAGPPSHLIAVAIGGAVPDERRSVALFATGSQHGGHDAALREAPDAVLAVPPDVVGFDVADLVPGGGVEVALLSARELSVVRPESGEPLISHRFALPLPLPPRTRALSRLAFLRPWEGNGAVSALVPALDGLRHIPLGDGRPLTLEVPLETRYEVMDASVGVRAGAFDAHIAWPQVALADDDGDGYDDLFALTRYDVVVFRAGPDGLSATPSRQVSLRPFTAAEEQRHLATSLSLYADDLDGDGLADLVLHRTIGTLLSSSSETLVFRNKGAGADPTAEPDLRIHDTGGFGAVFLQDVDGDGRSEILQTVVSFGVIQLMRVLVTEKVQAKFKLLRFEGSGVSETVTTWEEDLTLPLDFSNGRVSGVIPNLRGDLNGDGLRDLVWGDSIDHLSVRLGERGQDGPRFGERVARQTIPGGERALVADLNGDGLDDLVLHDTFDDEGRLHVLHNLGRLPGSPTSLEAAGPE
jgi:hypothetical protein